MKTWRDYASCLGQDARMFLLPEDNGIMMSEALEIRKVLEAGVEVCRGCPVVGPCWADSDEVDRNVTVRGGELPSGLTPLLQAAESRTYPHDDSGLEEAYNALPVVTDLETCEKGHKVHYTPEELRSLSSDKRKRVGADSNGRCRSCKMTIRKRYTRNRSKS